MASIVRICFSKTPAKALTAKINVQTVRTITSKFDELPPKPKPYDYINKRYTLLNYIYDKTTSRFDENTKLIVVDGPPAAGKSKFGKEIAKAFGMQYYPEANLEMEFINSYGYDLRKLDPMLPPDCKSFDIPDFLRSPNHKLTARMQISQYITRLSQYVDALAHILSTGQGVVLDRSVYSDFVFAEAMYSQRFLSRAAYKKYYEYRDNTIDELLKPHLVVYLDVPVPKVMENIQKRNISYEKNSPALSQQYLEVIDRNYKQNYLKEVTKDSELLVYDWTVEGDMEIVLEDIEAIDFTRYDYQDTQLQDWVNDLEEDWAVLRNKYADKKDEIMSYCHIPDFDVPELMVEATDIDQYFEALASAPGQEYEHGYNTKMGDGGLLLKMGIPKRETLPMRERRTE